MKNFLVILFVLVYHIGQSQESNVPIKGILPDICKPDWIRTPYTEISIWTTCIDKSKKTTYLIDSVDSCKSYISYYTLGYMLDSTHIGQDFISTSKIWTLTRVDSNRWLKTDFDFNEKEAGRYYLEQIIPTQITSTDTNYLQDLLTGEISVENIVDYVKFKWTK